jgi:hypothetical protein
MLKQFFFPLINLLVEIESLSPTESLLSKVKDIADIANSLATIIALIIGGIWSYILFVRKRQKFSSADLTHQIKHMHIGNGKILLHVSISVINKGSTLLTLASGVTKIKQLLPLPIELQNRLVEGNNLVEEGNSEVIWPNLQIRRINWEEELEIEPGESDQLIFDFVLDEKIQIIQVYTHLMNELKRKGERPLGWGLTTTYDISPKNNSIEKESAMLKESKNQYTLSEPNGIQESGSGRPKPPEPQQPEKP